jgi:hypothetical protein
MSVTIRPPEFVQRRLDQLFDELNDAREAAGLPRLANPQEVQGPLLSERVAGDHHATDVLQRRALIHEVRTTNRLLRQILERLPEPPDRRNTGGAPKRARRDVGVAHR